MLEVPVRGTEQQKVEPPPPCYRCLFDKPVSEGWCDPQTCALIEYWLLDKDFKWEKYITSWVLSLELRMNQNNKGDSVEESE